MNKLRLILIGLVLGIAFSAGDLYAEKDFSSWRKYSSGKLISETNGLAPGQIGTIGLKLSMVAKWHTYWVNPGDSGAPIRLKFKTESGVKIREVHFPYPKRDLTSSIVSFMYSGDVVFPIDVSLSDSVRVGESVKIEVDAEWLVCERICIPAIDKLSITLPVNRLEDIKPTIDFNLFQNSRARIPAISNEPIQLEFSADKATLVVPSLGADEEVQDFFPFRGSGVTNRKGTFDFSTGRVELERGASAQKESSRIGVVLIQSKVNHKLRSVQYGDSGWSFISDASVDRAQIWWMLLSAFLGGLILNLMPCVFPILSMKLFSLLKLGKAHAREVREQNLAYVAGVLVSFLTIALVLSGLRSAGQLVGWGFQLQSPVFLTLLIWLFVGLALNLVGLFELNILDAGFGHRLTRLGGVWGSFFTGVLAVIVASPCTAPFMGAALGFGIGQPLPILVSVFLMIGLGLSFPYLIFVVFPDWTHYLPRPGNWMIYLKQAMAVPLIATAGWLLWVLIQVRDVQVANVVGGGALLLVLSVWYSGVGRKFVSLLTVLVLISSVVWIYSSQSDVEISSETSENWESFTEAKFHRLKTQNLFVNMTADWCLSCKVNEKLVFSDPEVLSLLKGKNVTLLKGDWTQRNAEITRFLNRYDRVGVPFYVIFSSKHPNGFTLPEVLTKSMFIDWINSEYP